MMKLAFLDALLASSLFALSINAGDSNYYFSQPADYWVDTLPIGNGRLGATLYGTTDRDIIVLNEDSFWSGGFRNRINPKAKDTFPKVRSLMDAGRISEAGDTWLGGMSGVPTSQRKYEPAGYLIVKTGHANGVSDYQRSLDLSTGVANVTYSYGGTKYVREAVASAPDNVIAFRYTASSPRSYNMTITLDRGSGFASTGSDGGLYLRSRGADDSAYTTSQYAFVTTIDGTISSDGTSITVTGATEVNVFWDAETLYYYPSGQATYEKTLSDRIGAARQKGYASIRQSSTADHSNLYKQASFSVGSGSADPNRSIDKRLADFKSVGDFSQDPGLLTLGYNFGRYLLIASSRPGTLPANLQGIWSNSFNPPWDSKFTIDINLQMNYWLSDTNGLGDLARPVWDLLGRMRTRGTQVASDMYGLPGWVCHHNTDIWGDCAPQDNGTQWTIWPMGGPWVLHTAIEHYRFSQDLDFAKNVALPLLKSAIQFYDAYSVDRNGFKVTYPSNSPENSYTIPQGLQNSGSSTGIDSSPQSDRALMYILYQGFIELSNAAGSTDGVASAQTYLSKIKPPDVSSQTSRLLEWSRDFAETEPEHRHFSPCIGLHPGNQYGPLSNRSLADAAANLISHRMTSGSGSTGWSRIWSSMLYSRLFDGNNAVSSIATVMSSYMYNNLWAVTSGVFQADANYGLAHAVNEMFLQSQSGFIHIGAAMPSSQIGSGSFTGWRTRGGFVVDATWSGGQIRSATITSSKGNDLAIRVQGGRSFSVNGRAYSGPVKTTAGSKYTIGF